MIARETRGTAREQVIAVPQDDDKPYLEPYPQSGGHSYREWQG